MPTIDDLRTSGSKAVAGELAFFDFFWGRLNETIGTVFTGV
jgi:hypothetical protein